MFSRYRLEKLVGRGGMGVVWAAFDTRLERQVALKFLPEVTFLDAAARDELKRETRRSLDLTHPHIVRIHDFIEDEEAAAIAMEFIDGPTLSHLRVERTNRCFDCDDLRRWTEGLCRALHYAHHTASCVHRDLKPSNLMVNSRDVLKVADFGIACGLQNTAARVSAWSSTGGTLGYMSPQQLRGELAAPSDDLYSLGATLFELLTSKPPFFSGDLSLQIRDRLPESMTERRRTLGIEGVPIDPRWEETIAALLAKDPLDRPRDAREVAQRLGLESAPEAAVARHEALPLTMVQRRTAPIPEIIAPQRAGRLQAAETWLRQHLTIVTGAMALILLGWFQLSHRGAPPPPAVVKVTASIPASAPAASSATTPVPAAEPERPIAAEEPPALLPAASSSAHAAALEIVTVPAGIPFRIVRQAYEGATKPGVELTGVSPALVEELSGGSYRVVFMPPGAPERSLAVQVEASGFTPCRQTFPHATITVSSQPAGAEIFLDDRSVGMAPLELAVLPGKYEIDAQREDREARPRTVTVGIEGRENLNFDFRTAASSSKSRARVRKPKKPDDTAFTKIGRSISKLFGGEKTARK